jgi:hypothetical protein
VYPDTEQQILPHSDCSCHRVQPAREIASLNNFSDENQTGKDVTAESLQLELKE